MSTTVLHTTDRDFQVDVVERSRTTPVLLDLFADWCGPCRALSPLLDVLAGELAGRLVVVKINAEQNPQSRASHNVRGFPTLVLYKNGVIVDRHSGSPGTRARLKAWVETRL